MSSLRASSVVLALLLTTTADGASGNAPLAKRIEPFALKDALGTTRSLDDWKDQKAVVVVFLGTDCPLARLYGPKLSQLAQKYHGKQVQFVGIDANQQDSLAQIGHYVRTSKIEFPVLKDLGNKVADRFGAVRTPEVFLLDQSRVVRYRGPIDDQFGIGVARGKAVHNYLEDALDAVLGGKPVATAFKDPVGCRIGRINQRPAKGDVTYSNQIARILQARCVGCHQAGEIAPFSLTSYGDAVGWAETIREVVRDQRMPPWFANPAYGKFQNDCRLTDDEKRLLNEWIDNGVPEGDPSQLPKPTRFAEGWRIPKPDFIVKMPQAVQGRRQRGHRIPVLHRRPGLQARRVGSRRREQAGQPQRGAPHGPVLHAAGANRAGAGRLAFPHGRRLHAGNAAADAARRHRPPRSGRFEAGLPDALHAQRHRTSRSERGRARLCRSRKR